MATNAKVVVICSHELSELMNKGRCNGIALVAAAILFDLLLYKLEISRHLLEFSGFNIF